MTQLTSVREVAIAVIGAGTAGMSAFRSASSHTDDVVLIDPGPLGTTCARVGCMPSKLLVAAAEAAHASQVAPAFGVNVGSVTVNGRAVMARVQSERDRFVGFVLESVAAWPPERIIRQKAHFVAPMTLRLEDGQLIRAQRIVIATGSRPRVPIGWSEALGDRLLTNEEVFSWQDLPNAIAIVGAGAIGLELGQALSRLGVRVRIFSRSSWIGGLSDPHIAFVATQILEGDVPLSLGTSISTVSRTANGVLVGYQDELGTHEEHFDYVLCALGRIPNIDTLGLEHSGIPFGPSGPLRSDPNTCRVADTPIFIAGDAAKRRFLLHEAADDGQIAGDNAGRYPDVRVRPRRAGLSVVFCDPQIATAGKTYRELLAGGVDFVHGAVDFAQQGRARVMLRNQGRLHVYAHRTTGRFLGAEMVCPDAEHLGHLLAWAAHTQMTVQQMLDAPFYHPVVEEGVRTALRDVHRALQLDPLPAMATFR